jgi:hypothetical protein
MKNALEMTLSSRRRLTESAAKKQLETLFEFEGGLMRPDKCSRFEPIRTQFDASHLDKYVQGLAEPHGGFLYQKGKPVYMRGQMWNRSNSPDALFPSTLFSNYWTGQFDGNWARQVGMRTLEQFVFEMFDVTGSDFGLLTTEIDRKAKNVPADSFSYQGSDLGAGIPGLYWVNIFSEKLATWLKIGSLPSELASRTVLENGNMILKFCAEVEDCRDAKTLQKQRAAIEWIGSDRFFDLRSPERKLSVSTWES